MTASRLSSSTIQQLTPLLGSLARMAATGSQLSEHALNMLLLGADLDAEQPMASEELKRWGKILMAFKEQPSVELRRATVEALSLRGLPEAPVLLAVDTVANSSLAPTAVGKLKVTPERLDFGLLPSGKGVSAELEVEGGPGRIAAESDQVRVSHTRFGDGTTRVRVEVPPLTHGLLWTSVKLVTADETVEVPLLAQWEEVLVRDDTVPTTIEVPDLAGQLLSQARNKLAAVGLKLGGQNEAPNNTVSVGRISEQEPRAGMKAKRGSSVSVTVSTGPSRRSKKKKPLERVRVPNLVGQNAPVASGILKDAGLRYDFRNLVQSDAPNGAVIRQAPQAGTEVVRNSTVAVTVSAGRMEVPQWAAVLTGLVGVVVLVVVVIALQGGTGGDFEDNFSNTSSGWPDEEFYNGSSIGYSGYGTYDIFAEDSSYAYATAPAGSFEDVRVETDPLASSFSSEYTESTSLGVVCRVEDSDNYYVMGFHGDSSAFIGKVEDGDFTELDSSSTATALPWKSNITGECVGNSLSLYVNDNKILEETDYSFQYGEVGLWVRDGGGSSGTELGFNYFSARTIE